MNPRGIEYYWKLLGFTPNDAQRDTILHNEGPLFLTAGPGSGKTRVLLWRTVNLIVYQDVPPEEIFLSTFTEKAAKQLKDGLMSLLGLITNDTGTPFDLGRMSIGTVHSLCQSLLTDRRFRPKGARRRAPILIDELGQYFRIYRRTYWRSLLEAGGWDDEEVAQRAINDFLVGQDLYSRHHAAQNVISLFNRFTEESLDPDFVSTNDDTLQSLLRMYSQYIRDLKEEIGNGIEVVDFALLQQKALRLFSECDEAPIVFRHVIIDEYQDTNAIQEKLFFLLASGFKNICVVGDDDQALYRFRGATVENLVHFKDRCREALNVEPRRIDLSINYRSRRHIVDFYTDFISRIDWSDSSAPGRYHRIHDKRIEAHSDDIGPAVAISSHAKAIDVYAEVATFVKKLKTKGVITDYNQVAFLFPSMKGWNGMSTRVHGYIKAFLDEEIPFYAPRAGRFLEVEEAQCTIGLFMEVFGRPKYRDREDASAGYREFQNWLSGCREKATVLKTADLDLADFLRQHAAEFSAIQSDYQVLLSACEEASLDLKSPAQPDLTRRLSALPNISKRTQKALMSHRLNQYLVKRREDGDPAAIYYVLNRVTALDWSILDLFYRLHAFNYYREIFDKAERGEDEAPICNLGLLNSIPFPLHGRVRPDYFRTGRHRGSIRQHLLWIVPLRHFPSR